MPKQILKIIAILAISVGMTSACRGQQPAKTKETATTLLTGSEQIDKYLPLLIGKRVALLNNQTSRVGNTALVDTLIALHINVVKVFTPEHGFRGTADAGAHVANGKDEKTGLPIISLYGNNKKPTAAQLSDVDVLVYDLQDVGTRFYTYISTLEYAMDACIENNKELLILDRPNPNDFVDGPVLNKKFKSFVGMQEIPAVYGMTAGEYAKMLKGEKWIANAEKLNLKTITCKGWMHGQSYDLPVSPSPNLKDSQAVQHYPSLCFFEGTVVSVGRGTERPFTMWGHPDFKGKSSFIFTPQSTTGASAPQYAGKECYGENLQNVACTDIDGKRQLNLSYLLKAFNWYGNPSKFFNNFFDKLAGTDELRKQILAGQSEAAIRKSWQPGLAKFELIRREYLLYPAP